MMKKRISHLFYIGALALLLGVSGASAQFRFPEDQKQDFSKPMVVDYAFFRSADSDQVRLELYYQIHYRGLTFGASGGNLTAAYKLTVTVEGKGVFETFDRGQQVVLSEAETSRTRTDFRTSQISLDVQPGKYRAVFELRDETTGVLFTEELKFKIHDLYNDRPRLSAVEFLQAFERQAGNPGVFGKGDLTVVPSVHRIYGSLNSDRVAYYAEIYPGKKPVENAVIETKIRHFRRGMMYRDTLHVNLDQEVLRQLREISLSEFLPGEYELEISVLGRRNKQLASRSEIFRVAWTEEGMIRNDWKSTVQQLKLLSDEVDVGDIEDLETYAERVHAFQKFWADRDPTEGTVENETKIAFYYRVGIANARFSIMKRDGWKTDRGQIFVKYGEPDYMTDEPFSFETHPYQLWYYVNSVPVRTFYFIDENVDGDYRLQYPFDGISTGFRR